MIYLDTHVVVWLYETAKNSINENLLRISPMVVLDLTYLYEIGRLTVDSRTITDFLNHAIGLKVCDLIGKNNRIRCESDMDPGSVIAPAPDFLCPAGIF